LVRTFGKKFDALLSDPELLQIDASAALFLHREAELAERLIEEDTPAWRREALRLFRALQAAVEQSDDTAVAERLQKLGAHLEAGASRDEAWEALQANAERHAALADRAVGMETRKGLVVTNRQFAVVFRHLFEIVRDVAGQDAAYHVFRRFMRSIEAHMDLANLSLPESAMEGMEAP
jgi:hypothetical protein